jgi:hypothetical protein
MPKVAWNKGKTGVQVAWNRGKKLAPRKKPKPFKHKQITEGGLNRLFSTYIRLRDMVDDKHCKCFTCDKLVEFKKCHAGHFISRRYNATKYDPLNVHAQCIYCNTYLAGNQYVYSLKLDEKFGEGTAYSLYQKSKELLKIDAVERLKIRDTLLEMIEKMSINIV